MAEVFGRARDPVRIRRLGTVDTIVLAIIRRRTIVTPVGRIAAARAGNIRHRDRVPESLVEYPGPVEQPLRAAGAPGQRGAAVEPTVNSTGISYQCFSLRIQWTCVPLV